MATYINGKLLSQEEEDAKFGGTQTVKADPTPTEEPGWFQPGSKSDTAVRSFAKGATLGTAPYFGALEQMLTNGGSYKDNLAREQAAYDTSAAANPKTAVAANLAGGAPIALATGGESLPGIMAKNAITGGISGAADTGTVSGAIQGAGFGAGAAGVGGGLVKGAQAVAGSGRKALAAGLKDPAIMAKIEEEHPELVSHVFDSAGNVAKQRGTDSMVDLFGKALANPNSPTENFTQPVFQTISKFITDSQPTVGSQVSKSVKDSIKNYMPQAVMGTAMGGGVGGLTGAATTAGITAGLAGSAALAKGAGQGTINASMRATTSPMLAGATNAVANAPSQVASTTGAEFNQIMNMIDQGNQQHTPQEATDYVLQQLSPTYRDIKTTQGD